MLSPFYGFFHYSINEMIFALKLDLHFGYGELLDLELQEFKWFFKRLELQKELNKENAK